MITPTSELVRTDPAAFCDLLKLNEKRQPWRLSDYQRKVLRWAFRRGPDGGLLFRVLLWSECKKSGKSFLSAVLGLWWALTHPHTEVEVLANDLDQSVGRVGKTMIELVKANPGLGRFIKILSTELRFTNGSVITFVASDYKGGAGSRHSLAIFDELWGYQLENARRLYEEKTPPPTEPDAWVLIATTAGFTGESKLLEELYERAIAGTRVDDALELYEADELFAFWSHVPRQPWQTEAYYAQQRRILRPSTYLRLHENRWTSSESQFITGEMWDANTDPDMEREPTPEADLYVGVDASYKGDSSAVVAVERQGPYVRVAGHRIWKPSAAAPLDLELTIERHLRELCARYSVRRICADPYQMHRSITTLQRGGLPIVEFPQTSANTCLMGQTLWDLLREEKLYVYPDPELKQHALNAVAIESPNGFRLAKEKASKKIDAVVALSMACVAAMAEPARIPAPMCW